MKNKFFTLVSLSVLTLIMITGFASADALELDLVSSPSSVIAGEDVTVVFNLSSPDASYTALNWALSSTNIGSWTILPLRTTIGIDETYEVSAVLSVPLIATGIINAEIDLQSETDAEAQLTIPTITITAPLVPEEILSCAITAEAAGSDNDDLQLSIEDVQVTGFGDEYEWFPFDEVEVEINIENDNNDYNIKGIELEWGLYDKNSGDWYYSDEESDFKLGDGDDKTLDVTLTLDDDVDELPEGDYVFYVWANAELDAETDISICASAYEDITIVDEDDFVIAGDIEYLETTECGTVVELTADIWNIGDEDQEEVVVVVQSEELGITERVEIGDIDSFEDEKLSVLLEIPEDAEEESYLFVIMVFDEYGDKFENDFDEDKAEFLVYLKVEGNCKSEPKVSISADLISEAKSGRELVVSVTVLNTGSNTGTFDVSFADVSWASLVSVAPESVTLDAGESEDVVITLDVNSGVLGDQNFNVVVTEGTKVLSQPVSVMIEKGGFSGFSGITGGAISESNWPIWTIGAVNLVLVFIIILVALKISKK